MIKCPDPVPGAPVPLPPLAAKDQAPAETVPQPSFDAEIAAAVSKERSLAIKGLLAAALVVLVLVLHALAGG